MPGLNAHPELEYDVHCDRIDRDMPGGNLAQLKAQMYLEAGVHLRSEFKAALMIVGPAA